MGLRDIFGRIVGSSEDRDQGYALNEKGWHAWYNSQMRQGYGTPLEFANGIAVSNPDMVIRLGSNPDEVAANYAMSERYRRRSDPSTNDPRLHNVNNDPNWPGALYTADELLDQSDLQEFENLMKYGQTRIPGATKWTQDQLHGRSRRDIEDILKGMTPEQREWMIQHYFGERDLSTTPPEWGGTQYGFGQSGRGAPQNVRYDEPFFGHREEEGSGEQETGAGDRDRREKRMANTTRDLLDMLPPGLDMEYAQGGTIHGIHIDGFAESMLGKQTTAGLGIDAYDIEAIKSYLVRIAILGGGERGGFQQYLQGFQLGWFDPSDPLPMTNPSYHARGQVNEENWDWGRDQGGPTWSGSDSDMRYKIPNEYLTTFNMNPQMFPQWMDNQSVTAGASPGSTIGSGLRGGEPASESENTTIQGGKGRRDGRGNRRDKTVNSLDAEYYRELYEVSMPPMGMKYLVSLPIGSPAPAGSTYLGQKSINAMIDLGDGNEVRVLDLSSEPGVHGITRDLRTNEDGESISANPIDSVDEGNSDWDEYIQLAFDNPDEMLSTGRTRIEELKVRVTQMPGLKARATFVGMDFSAPSWDHLPSVAELKMRKPISASDPGEPDFDADEATDDGTDLGANGDVTETGDDGPITFGGRDHHGDRREEGTAGLSQPFQDALSAGEGIWMGGEGLGAFQDALRWRNPDRTYDEDSASEFFAGLADQGLDRFTLEHIDQYLDSLPHPGWTNEDVTQFTLEAQNRTDDITWSVQDVWEYMAGLQDSAWTTDDVDDFLSQRKGEEKTEGSVEALAVDDPEWTKILAGINYEIAQGEPSQFFPGNIDNYLYTHTDGKTYSIGSLPPDMQNSIRTQSLSNPNFVQRAIAHTEANRPDEWTEDWTVDPLTYQWVAPRPMGLDDDGEDSYVDLDGEDVSNEVGDGHRGLSIPPNPYHADLGANYDTTTGQWVLPATTLENYNPNPGGVGWVQDERGNWGPPPPEVVVDNGVDDGIDVGADPIVIDPVASDDPNQSLGLMPDAAAAAGDRLDRAGQHFRDPEEERRYWDWQLKPAVDAAEAGFKGILGDHIGAGTFGAGMMDAQTARMMGDFRRDIGEDYMFPYMRERGEEERADIDTAARIGEAEFRMGEDQASRIFDERMREAEVTGYLDDTISLAQLGYEAADYFNEQGNQSIDQRKAYERDLPGISAAFERVMGRELTSSELERLVAGQDVEVMRPTSSRYATEEEIRQSREKITLEGRRVSVEENKLDIDQTLAMLKEWEVRGYTDTGERIGSWLRHMEDRDYEALVKGGGYYTRLDDNGNPLPELDANGRPVLDENGEPVYQRIRIYGTDELADRQFIRDEDKRNGYHRVSTYVDENGVEQIRYDQNGDTIIERVYGSDEIERLDRERDDQWARDKYTGFYHDAAGYGHPIWIAGEIGLEEERNKLAKELKQMGFDQETSERVAEQNYKDKIAQGYWGHDGTKPVYVMGTQAYDLHVQQIANDLSIDLEEARMFLRAQEREGFNMVVEVPLGIDEDGETIFGTRLRRVKGTWKREDEVQSRADQLTRDGWDAQTARITAEYEARARDRNGYWQVKQTYNPTDDTWETQYDNAGRPILEWAKGSAESEAWITAEASRLKIDEAFVKDALSRATGDAAIVREGFITARAKALMSQGKSKEEAYLQAREESEALDSEKFKEQYGETLEERLAKMDLDAADKRADAAEKRALINASIQAIATIGAAAFPLIFGKDGIMNIGEDGFMVMGTLAYLRTLFPDASDDELELINTKISGILEEHGYKVRKANGDGEDPGGNGEDPGGNSTDAEKALGHVKENENVRWGPDGPIIDPERLNGGPWDDEDWTYADTQNQKWFDNGGVIDIDDLFAADNWEDYLRSGTSVNINGHEYTAEGFADLYRRSMEDLENNKEEYQTLLDNHTTTVQGEEWHGSGAGETGPQISTTEIVNEEAALGAWIEGYEMAHGADLEPGRWWQDFRGQGKRGLLKAASRLMMFNRGVDMTGKSESFKDYINLALLAYFNPTQLAFYVAGRTAGGLYDVWSGAHETRWEAGGIVLPSAQTLTAPQAGAYWWNKFMPPQFHEQLPSGSRNVRGVWARIRPTKDDLGREAMTVEWGTGSGTSKYGNVLYKEDLEVFIERTGQVPFSFIHMPAPQGSGSTDEDGNWHAYEHLGSFMEQAFDLDFTPEYALVDVNDNILANMSWDGNPVERQFPGEQVVRFISTKNPEKVMVVSMSEWEAKGLEFDAAGTITIGDYEPETPEPEDEGSDTEEIEIDENIQL